MKSYQLLPLLRSKNHTLFLSRFSISEMLFFVADFRYSLVVKANLIATPTEKIYRFKNRNDFCLRKSFGLRRRGTYSSCWCRVFVFRCSTEPSPADVSSKNVGLIFNSIHTSDASHEIPLEACSTNPSQPTSQARKFQNQRSMMMLFEQSPLRVRRNLTGSVCPS